MSNLAKTENNLATTDVSPEIMGDILLRGDLSGLNENQRIEYHNAICQRCKLDPVTRPFDYIKLNGKLVLYANKCCCGQLRRIHGISVIDCDTKIVGELFVVTVKVQNKIGRLDCGIGAVDIGRMQGLNKANAIMKCETKAKRRATLSICELGMLDDSELDTLVEVEDSKAKKMLVKDEPKEKFDAEAKIIVEKDARLAKDAVDVKAEELAVKEAEKTAAEKFGRENDVKECRYICQDCDREFDKPNTKGSNLLCPHCLSGKLTDRQNPDARR